MKRLMFFLLIIILAGCAPKADAPKAAYLKAMFPVNVGSTWQYQGEGNEYATFTREVVFANGSKAQIKEENGGTISAAVFEVTDTEVKRVYFQGEQYEQGNFLDAVPNENLVILKAPIQVGTKWETPEDTREIVDINATVETPAGKFEGCVKVKISSEGSDMYEYFKTGVGMVKREFTSGKISVTSTLSSYLSK